MGSSWARLPAVECTVPIALWLATAAQAQWTQGSEAVSLSGMTEHAGDTVVDADLLGLVYRQVVGEIGAFAANKPVHPAKTLGQYGWEVGVDTTIAIVTTWNPSGDPSAWERVTEDESPSAFQWVPAVHVRKGLPMSTEVGFTAGWVGLTQTGTVGGYGRVGVLNGYRPLPDITLQVGYAGYIGNDELELGVLDLGVSIGSTYGMGGVPGVRHGQFLPWLTFSSNRVTAQPLLDTDLAADIGAVGFGGKQAAATDDAIQPALFQPTFGGGFQIVSGNVHFRASAAWSWTSVPTISTGAGFTF